MTNRARKNWIKLGMFAGGVLFGTAGIKILSSRGAKKFYTGVTACALASKDCVMKTTTKIQENASDIYEDAKDLNEKWAAEAQAKKVEDEKE